MADLDTDLLALADDGGGYNDQQGSDEDAPGETVDMYPIEGKYIDEEDRQRILGMSELEREAILGERAEAQADRLQRQKLRQMVQERDSRNTGQAAKQAERGRKLDELRQRRENRATPPKKKKKSGKKSKYSYDDDEEEDDENDQYVDDDEEQDEDDYVIEEEEEDEYDARDSRRYRTRDDVYEDQDEEMDEEDKFDSTEPAGPADLQSATVTRSQIAAVLRAPWFKEWIIGSWVRYLVGINPVDGQRAYRLCQIVNVAPSKQPYRIEGVKVQFNVILKHGKSERAFPMENISNSPFDTREFVRLSQTFRAENLAMPTQGEVLQKAAYIKSHTDYLLTEADVASLIATRKKESIVERKSRLIIAREQAATQKDEAAWHKANNELKELLGERSSDAPPGSSSSGVPVQSQSTQGTLPSSGTGSAPSTSASNGSAANKPASAAASDIVARINERNRSHNSAAGRRKLFKLDAPKPVIPMVDKPLEAPPLHNTLLRELFIATDTGLFEYSAAKTISLPLDTNW